MNQKIIIYEKGNEQKVCEQKSRIGKITNYQKLWWEHRITLMGQNFILLSFK